MIGPFLNLFFCKGGLGFGRVAQRPVFADDELKEVFLGWWDEDDGMWVY